MKTLRELKGLSVLTLEEGERLGQVRDLILDPASAHVLALVLDRRAPGGEPQVVATANVRHVGSAAITVEDRSSLVPLSRIPRFQDLARARRPIEGRMVISEDGQRLGQVGDLQVDETNFRAVSLILRSTFKRGRIIPIEQVRTIGADAIVVRAAAPAMVPPGPAEEPPAPAGTGTPGAPPPEEAPRGPAAAPLPEVAPALGLAAEPGGEPPAPSEPSPEGELFAAPLPTEEGSAPPAAESDQPPEENAWQRWVRRLARRE